MFRNSGFFSVFISVLFHLAIIVPLILSYSGLSVPGQQVIEIGLGSGEPEGGHAGGGPSVPVPEEKIPIKSTEKKVVKEEKKTEVKKSDDKSENTSPGITSGGSGEGYGTGSGTGTGKGSGTGTGTGGSGIPIPPPVEKKDETYYVAVEQMPEPIGGRENILSKLPPSLQNTGKGTVYVLAFIDEDGIVKKVLLAKGIGNPYDDAAMNAVRRSRFRAGKKQGQYVKVQYHVAVTF